MAKVNVEFDTLDKTLSLSVDGKAVNDVAYVSMGKRYGSYGKGDEASFSCCFETSVKDEENDMNTCVRVCASESLEGEKLTNFECYEDLPGFKVSDIVVNPKTASKELINAVAAFFGAEVNEK